MNDARSPWRCPAICSTHGQRCRSPVTRLDGLCGRHSKVPPEVMPEADGDGEHVVSCNQAIIDAMNHPEWPACPREVRRLIEQAWLALSRAVGDE